MSIFYNDRPYSDEGALLLETGQETSYHAGDDGDLELGVAHDYTVLTTGQHSGTTAIVINGKTCDLSNNCVKDNNTKKMWARSVPQSDIGPAANGKLFWEQWTLVDELCYFTAATKKITAASGSPFDISALCVGRKITITNTANNNAEVTVAGIASNVITTVENITDEAPVSTTFATVDDLIWDLVDQANANGLGGYTDWRLPNRFELESIADLSRCSPAIDSAIFPSTPTDRHWASSTYPCYSVSAFTVYFSNGIVNYSNKKTSKHYIRLVRD